jgi:signal transduction histidine kinase
VCDTGPGIPSETIPHLFERYWRGDYRRASAKVNMGLGLSIVHEIVKAHEGTVAIDNHAEGADFYFTLPVHISQKSNQASLGASAGLDPSG